jgi:hypothetical protein
MQQKEIGSEAHLLPYNIQTLQLQWVWTSPLAHYLQKLISWSFCGRWEAFCGNTQLECGEGLSCGVGSKLKLSWLFSLLYCVTRTKGHWRRLISLADKLKMHRTRNSRELTLSAVSLRPWDASSELCLWLKRKNDFAHCQKQWSCSEIEKLKEEAL